MLQTIEELKAGGYRRVRFPDDNKVHYFMDFSFREGLPSDIDFFVVHEPHHRDGWVTLKARGYGVQDDYGNGSIFIETSELPEAINE